MDCWRLAICTSTMVVLALAGFAGAQAADPAVERGKYLDTIASCTDCHTPGYFLGKPDVARQFGGSDVGFEIPGLGVFYGPNLTPDKETGLGGWTDAQIAMIAYLKSLPPVRNKVPGPLGPLEPPTSYVMKVVPPKVQNVVLGVGATLAERWCAN